MVGGKWDTEPPILNPLLNQLQVVRAAEGVNGLTQRVYAGKDVNDDEERMERCDGLTH